MNINVLGIKNSVLGKGGSIAVSVGMVLMAYAPILAFPQTALAVAGVGISTVNGQAPNPNVCIASNPVIVVITGTTGSQGGNYSLDINWGDGSAVQEVLITPDPIGKDEPFSVTLPHTFLSSSSNIGLFLYHGQPGGQDATADASSNIAVCITPTTGGLVVKKSLFNAGGGTAATTSFSFTVNAGSPIAFEADGQNDLINLAAGAFSVVETSAPHYSVGYSGCSGTIVAGATSTCTITNTFHNAAPVAQDSSVSTDEDTLLSSSVSATDSDDDALTYAVVASPSNTAAFVFNSNGTFSYTPVLNYNGPDSFTFQAFDGFALSNTATVNITVNPINDNPDAVNDSANVNEDSANNVIDVLANDVSTPDASETLTVQSVGSATNGTATLDAGVVKYTPNAGYVGSDSFTYTISDGNGGTDTATVSVLVSNTNDNPDAVNDSATVAEDSTDNVIDVLSNDTILPDSGETLSITEVSTPTNGSAVIDGTTIKYTPNANFNGSDSFTYTISDGNGGTDTATVNVTVTAVNDAPVANAQTLSTQQNLSVSGALTASDVDNDSLTFATTSNPANGTLTFFSSTGLFTYLPNNNFSGSDSFTFVANDGSVDSAPATVTINVASSPEDTLPLCSDTEDNDNDGLIDLADPDCAAFIPSLTLAKVVEGSEASPTNWTLTASTQGEEPQVVLTGAGEASGTVMPGTYTLAEEGPGHYAASPWGCVINDQEEVIVGNTVTLAIGDTAICAIVNTFTPFSSNVSVVKTIDDSTPDAGQTVTFTLTASNAGPDSAANVAVTDILPEGLTYVSDDGAGSYATSTGVWTIGALSNGSSTTLTIVATVSASAGQTVTNTASVTSENADNDSQDNTAAVSVTVNTPVVTPPPSPSRGGSSDFGNPTFGPPAGSVLGASTSTGQVLGESCGVYMDKHLRLGSRKNDVEQAKKLQAFLNKWMKADLPITGFYGPMTEAVVRKFQAQYSDAVLSPWGINSPTGLVYLSTLRQVNLLECPELTLPLPNLVPWSQNPNAQ